MAKLRDRIFPGKFFFLISLNFFKKIMVLDFLIYDYFLTFLDFRVFYGPLQELKVGRRTGRIF